VLLRFLPEARIPSSGPRSTLPVLIMTGHGDVPLAVEAMKLGAVDFLEKPFEYDRLIGMIDIALKQAESSARNEAATLDIVARSKVSAPGNARSWRDSSQGSRTSRSPGNI
jgi:FixJ family two-component response regulator